MGMYDGAPLDDANGIGLAGVSSAGLSVEKRLICRWVIRIEWNVLFIMLKRVQLVNVK